jgi:hypothetical protein
MAHFLFFAALFLPGEEYLLHPLHLSKSVIEYSPGNQALNATIYIFLDDLEAELKREGAAPLYLCTPRESSLADQYLESYFRAHLFFTAGGRKIPCRLLGKEPSDDGQAAWCYMECSPVPVSGRIKINCSILTETYGDQKNLVHFIVPGAAYQTAVLSRTKTGAEFVLRK